VRGCAQTPVLSEGGRVLLGGARYWNYEHHRLFAFQITTGIDASVGKIPPTVFLNVPSFKNFGVKDWFLWIQKAGDF